VCIDSQSGLEADAQIAEIHLVLVREGVEEREMAGDGEQKVIVEWGELRELIAEDLWGFGGAHRSGSHASLCGLWENLIWKLPQPSLEHRTDDIYIVEIGFVEEVDIEF
jgi:hypothetical protein